MEPTEINPANADAPTEMPTPPAAGGAMEEEEDFEAMLEASFKEIKEGEVVTGKIIQIEGDYVLVDIGYKSEGQIPIDEFKDVEGKVNVEVGDEVDVFVELRESESGMVILSKEKADKLKIWDEISRACEQDEVVEGQIVQRVKGGLQVDIGVRAFLPGSQVDLRPIRNLDKLIGQRLSFKVLKFNKKRGNIVLSRRVLLEKEREEAKKRTLSKLREGIEITGVVKNITDYGAFIDLGGIDGLLHITDMSWGRVKHPTDVLSVGDTVTVKVLKFDEERERVSLGLKQMQPDPWESAEEKYPVGTRITGRVVSLTDYGAFVEIEPGIEGLIHVSEMSWTRKIKHPSKILSEGDQVDAIVLNLDAAAKRISLGMKQTEPNPWDTVEQKYPVGTKIRGKIRNITDFGIFIGLDEGIDGLVHVSDISWNPRFKNPSELFKKNEEVEAVVLAIDKENERFSLGIKQLQPDPWLTIPERYKPGTIVEGTVINTTDFGVFLKIEEGLEGLVHISELPRDDPNFKEPRIGDKLPAAVLDVNPRERKIRLSVTKALSGEAEMMQEYLEEGKSTLGDILRSSGIHLHGHTDSEAPTQERTPEQGSSKGKGKKGKQAAEETGKADDERAGASASANGKDAPAGEGAATAESAEEETTNRDGPGENEAVTDAS